MQRSSRAQRVGRSTERQGKPCGMGPLRARRDAAMPALPTRPGKPRRRGITSLIDRGPDLGGWLGLRGTRDFLEVAAPYVDYAKIYAVQSLMLPAAWIARKIRLYRRYRVEPYAGGVLMELAWQQRRMTGYFRLVKKLGFQTIEVSENFVKLSPKERRATIREAVEEHDLSVVWEYGSKEPWAPLLVDDFVAAAHEALESGATHVVLEQSEVEGLRESNPDALAALGSKIGAEYLVFEADPLQFPRPHVWLLQTFGPEVSLGNVHPDQVIRVEEMRRGIGRPVGFSLLSGQAVRDQSPPGEGSRDE